MSKKLKKKNKTYYTIYLGNDIWQDVIDDMNTTEIWARGGMIWESKKKAEACMKNLKGPAYYFETPKRKFKIVKLYFYD